MRNERWVNRFHYAWNNTLFFDPLDVNIYEILNSKAMSRGGGGKLVTVYPRDDDEFRRCLEDLGRELEGVEGPYVLSDVRYKDHKALYFRLDYVRSTFLFEPDERFRVPRGPGPALLGVPGEGMTRCATDYLTGSAGVLRVLHRVNHGGGTDFLLDEAAP